MSMGGGRSPELLVDGVHFSLKKSETWCRGQGHLMDGGVQWDGVSDLLLKIAIWGVFAGCRWGRSSTASWTVRDLLCKILHGLCRPLGGQWCQIFYIASWLPEAFMAWSLAVNQGARQVKEIWEGWVSRDWGIEQCCNWLPGNHRWCWRSEARWVANRFVWAGVFTDLVFQKVMILTYLRT